MARSEQLYDLCDAVLTIACMSLDSIVVDQPDLDGCPTRSFISPGPPAAECCGDGRGSQRDFVHGQLTVHVDRVFEASTQPLTPSLQPALRYASTGRVIQSAIVVTLLRCAPTGAFTPALKEKIQRCSRQVYADDWAIYNGLWEAQRDPEHSAFAPYCDGVQFMPSAVIPQQGGCVGFAVALLPTMQGYDPLDGV